MKLAYNVGLTEAELDLLIRLIDIDDLTDTDEADLAGIRRKLVNKRKMLRRRQREQTLDICHET
jgi:predicted DNA-binding protein (UPF0251 family)